MLIVYLVALVINGLIIGALGRFAVPGPNPMSIAQTILIGIAGSFVGGLVGLVLFGDPEALGFILAVLAAALIVWLVERRRVPDR
jgi:uncharacterized membrane protein YeaQ/YmgE (transglycosylase-associated protein family)